MLARVFKAFQHRDFRIMWAGACTSSVGTWMQKLAQAWLVLQLSNSPFLLGLDAFLGEIPILLFSLIGGVVADRHDRRHLLLLSQFVQMSCAFLLTGLIFFKVVEVWHILVLSFVVGTAQSFGGPAYQALIPTLVGVEDLSNAIAMNSVQFNLARVIGPMIGGIALTTWGATWCFFLNGLSFIAVIVSLLAIRIRFIPARTGLSVLGSMKQGLQFVRRHPAMPSLVFLAFSMTLLGVPLIVFLPVFARDVLKSGASTYTILLSVYGCGSIVGALMVAYLGYVRTKGRLSLLSSIGLGAAMALFAATRTLAVACVFLFFAGAFLVGVLSLLSSLVQELTEDNMRGRVMSVYNVAFRGGMPIGSLVMGALVPHLTAPVVLAVNGVLLSILGAWHVIFRKKVSEI